MAPARQWQKQREVKVADAFAKEKPMLVELPGDHFPAAEIVKVTAGKTPYVSFDSNRYSVPHDRVRRQLVIRANSVGVKIFDRDELVAVHRRCWAKHQVVENPEHVAALVREKRQASRHRAQERLLRTVPQCEALLAEIGRRQRHLATAVRRLTQLLDLFGRQEMSVAVAEALAKGSPSAETVQLILDRRRRAQRQPPATPVRLPDKPRLQGITVTPHDLAQYDTETSDDEDD